jgi:hypothetical protein
VQPEGLIQCHRIEGVGKLNHLAQGFERLADGPDKGLCRYGGIHADRRSKEQRVAEYTPEMVKAFRYRRLTEAQILRRSSHATGTVHGLQYVQQVQVKVAKVHEKLRRGLLI